MMPDAFIMHRERVGFDDRRKMSSTFARLPFFLLLLADSTRCNTDKTTDSIAFDLQTSRNPHHGTFNSPGGGQLSSPLSSTALFRLAVTTRPGVGFSTTPSL